MTKTAITPELDPRAALAHIPATCDRETWARVAIPSSPSIQTAQAATFSLTGAPRETFDPKATAATWRSVKKLAVA